MNVASPELCKELYELSRWDADGNHWWYSDGQLVWAAWIAESTPAYELGYTLRKLPDFVRMEWWTEADGKRQYRCAYRDTIFLEDTPEDAVTKLAIELFKQGVLTRDGDE